MLVNKILNHNYDMEYSFLLRSSALTVQYIHRRPGYRAYWNDVTIEHTTTKVVVVCAVGEGYMSNVLLDLYTY